LIGIIKKKTLKAMLPEKIKITKALDTNSGLHVANSSSLLSLRKVEADCKWIDGWLPESDCGSGVGRNRGKKGATINGDKLTENSIEAPISYYHRSHPAVPPSNSGTCIFVWRNFTHYSLQKPAEVLGCPSPTFLQFVSGKLTELQALARRKSVTKSWPGDHTTPPI
jgi:hypothetical protein